MTDTTAIYKISIVLSAGDTEGCLTGGDNQWQSPKTADYGRIEDHSETAQTALLLNEVLQKTVDVCQAMVVSDKNGERSSGGGANGGGTGDWVVEGYSESPPDMDTIDMVTKLVFEMRNMPHPPQITVQQLPPMDWVAENQKSFQPVTAGRFFVHTSDYDGRVPYHKIPLVLNAGAAFGTGGHGTTAGCLQALSDLHKTHNFTTILDVGTGTGILALATGKLWRRASILATDISPTAIETTQYNMHINQSRWRLQTAVATSMTGQTIAQNAPYDLIVANILAGPLRAMSVDVTHALRRGGMVVLSGILGRRQKTAVVNAYGRCGLVLREQYEIDNWHTMVMTKK